MKMFLRLAIVVAALLLVNNAVFAATCTGDQELCYDLTATAPIGPSVSFTWMFCLNNDGTGNLCDPDPMGSCADYLKVFGGGPSWFNFEGDPQFGGKPNWTIWVAHAGLNSLYFQPLLGGQLLTGVLVAPGPSTQRIIYSGKKVPCP